MKKTTLMRLLHNPWLAIKPLAARGFLNFLPDSVYLKVLFRAELGKKLNLASPKSFNEKLQWLKLNDHQPEYVRWVDKIEAKELAREVLGEMHVVPLIAKWDKAEDIDFRKIPDICVLKCSHDQGSTIIYRRGKSDETKIVQYYKKRMKHNAFAATREWPYSQIKPRILCEPYLADEIIDYKLLCFNGQPRIVNIGQKSEEDKQMRITFLDLEWQQLPFQRVDFDRVKQLPEKPECFDELILLAKKLAAGRQFVRTDFFVVDKTIYFSEFTLYPTSGLIKFSPQDADRDVGEWLNISV